MKPCFKFALVAVVLFSSVVAQTNRNTFTDSRDGKTYRMVTIGNQTWMAENLNFATDEGSWCYDDDESNCNTYGRLYDWNTAMTACPQGWRLPSDADWTVLENAIGGSSTAGKKLKSRNGWVGSGNGIDNLGFSALPGGSRWRGSFVGIDLRGGWWVATEGGATGARVRVMRYSREDVDSNRDDKASGFSVRCVRAD